MTGVSIGRDSHPHRNGVTSPGAREIPNLNLFGRLHT